MAKLSKADLADIRDTIQRGGELRFHMIHSRSGMGGKARLWHPDGHVIATQGGCGYDREGALAGDVLELFFQEELSKLTPHSSYSKSGGTGYEPRDGGLYGLRRNDDTGHMSIDGACGWRSVEMIAEAMGWELSRFDTGKYSTLAFLRRK